MTHLVDEEQRDDTNAEQPAIRPEPEGYHAESGAPNEDEIASKRTQRCIWLRLRDHRPHASARRCIRRRIPLVWRRGWVWWIGGAHVVLRWRRGKRLLLTAVGHSPWASEIELWRR